LSMIRGSYSLRPFTGVAGAAGIRPGIHAGFAEPQTTTIIFPS
jgi:hypothetical protein